MVGTKGAKGDKSDEGLKKQLGYLEKKEMTTAE
jgi:hypothetical protein